MVEPGGAWYGKAMQGITDLKFEARRSLARRGRAWLSLARFGEAKQSNVRGA